MANVNDPKNQGKKMDANTAQKLREQLANRVSELSDEELSSVAGGTTPATPTVVASITAITTATGTEATKSVITGCVPSSGGSIPGPVPSPGASTI